MSKLTIVRAKLDKKLFTTDVLGSTVTLYVHSESTPSFGGYSGGSASYDAGTDYVAVPYNLISKEINYQPFGDLQEGDMDIVFRYSVSVNVKDKITFNGNTLYVKQVKPIPLNGGDAAIICRLGKQH